MSAAPQPSAIRAILQQDPAWAVYALGDLAPGFFEHCQWLTGEDRAALLLYREFSTPILWMAGAPANLQPLLAQVAAEPQLRLQIRTEAIPLVKSVYRLSHCKPMWRMALRPEDFQPAPIDGATRLHASDIDALRELYADGESRGEAPDFFFPSMLEQGVFFGAWAGDKLAAVAGTHLVADSESVAAIGNIYTHSEHRGQGHAARVTSALCQELRARGIATLALSVHQENYPAIHVYRKLGFHIHCPFIEGLAESK
jgi:ribosomal protein S18 acetylase RimI-like enzyme